MRLHPQSGVHDGVTAGFVRTVVQPRPTLVPMRSALLPVVATATDLACAVSKEQRRQRDAYRTCDRG